MIFAGLPFRNLSSFVGCGKRIGKKKQTGMHFRMHLSEARICWFASTLKTDGEPTGSHEKPTIFCFLLDIFLTVNLVGALRLPSRLVCSVHHKRFYAAQQPYGAINNGPRPGNICMHGLRKTSGGSGGVEHGGEEGPTHCQISFARAKSFPAGIAQTELARSIHDLLSTRTCIQFVPSKTLVCSILVFHLNRFPIFS